MADFTTVKSYSAATAEAAPGVTDAEYVPVPGSVKQRNRPRLMEFRLHNPSVSGSPTQVIFTIWRLNKADGTKDPIEDWVVNASDITAGKVKPPAYEVWGSHVTTQVTFVGGTSPAFTGSVQARYWE